MTIACRVCKSKCYSDVLLSYSNMPSSAQGFLQKEDLQFDTGSDLRVVQCESCGLIQLDNEPVSYYKKVIRASAFSEEMKVFRSEQFNLWIKKYKLTYKNILEVGCGKGEYLEILANAGVNAFGIEYSEESVNYCIQNNLSVTQGFLGDSRLNLLDQKYDGFICLSFMEHWPRPNLVFQSLNENLKDGSIGLIEVPNFDMILENGLYSEFISDHLLYFTKETLNFTLQLNGFEILSCEPIWHNYILSAVVRKRVKTNLDFFEDFKIIVKKDLDKFIGDLPNNKVAIWGAGHQALATISLTGIEKSIKFIVDSAVFKQDKYSPTSHIQIVSENKLLEDSVDAVIIMAGSYSDEIIKIMRDKYPFIKFAVLREFGLELFEN
jgi:2-polyprenyl-3-methyl-5-hydroxy-6-metoxy-1,4-benzoquinol methylase